MLLKPWLKKWPLHLTRQTPSLLIPSLVVNDPCITTLVSFFSKVLEANINYHGCFGFFFFFGRQSAQFFEQSLVVSFYYVC